MNESTIEQSLQDRSPEEDLPRELPSDDEGPRFGALEIVEAFTAMRHEWRGQTKESRALADQIQGAVENLKALEAKLLEAASDIGDAVVPVDDSSEARLLATLIAETDHQLSRAVAAIAQWESHRRRRDEADAKAADQYFAGMSRLARWFARPFHAFIAEQRLALQDSTENPAIEGLNLVLARLRRTMAEREIERLDVEGLEFDASTMHAIGTVESAECPSGHIAEQLSPAYLWQGELLRYADVRVAK